MPSVTLDCVTDGPIVRIVVVNAVTDQLISLCIATFIFAMLSSVVMRLLRPSRIVTVLLLSAFLLTSTGNAFGYAWCVGGDGHVEVNYVNDEECCVGDDSARGLKSSGVIEISQFDGKPCGLCLDFSAQQGEAVFFKRLKRTSTISIASFSPGCPPSTAIKVAIRSAAGVAPQALPRISSDILAHRTVVLLN